MNSVALAREFAIPALTAAQPAPKPEAGVGFHTASRRIPARSGPVWPQRCPRHRLVVDYHLPELAQIPDAARRFPGFRICFSVMPKKYVLKCQQCGSEILVEPAQAGQTVTCTACQSSQKLGTLRDIQALEVYGEPSVKPAPRRDSWSPARRTLFAGGVAALVLGSLFGGYMTRINADAMVQRPPTTMADEARKQVDDLSPVSMLKNWEQIDTAVVDQWAKADYLTAREEADQNRIYALSGWILAAVGLASVIGSLVVGSGNPPRER